VDAELATRQAPVAICIAGARNAAVPGKNNEDFHGISNRRGRSRESAIQGIAIAIADGGERQLGADGLLRKLS